VTLGLNVDLFSLTPADQDFVMGLVKAVRAYEEQFQLPAGSTSIEPVGGDADSTVPNDDV
jgi:hypothetical protein